MKEIKDVALKILRNMDFSDYDREWSYFINEVSKVVIHCVAMNLRKKLTEEEKKEIEDTVAGFLYDFY